MRRRQFLATTGGLAAVPVVAGRARSQSSSSFRPLGSLSLRGIAEAVVGDDGTTAYAAVSDGFATVDLSGPTAPAILAERRDPLAGRDGGPLDGIWDVKVDGDRLLVVGPAHGRTGNRLRAAAVYDVADPAAPERVGVHETTYPIHNSYLRDGVAYLTAIGDGGAELATVSVESDPYRLGGWALTDHDPRWADVPFALANLHDVYVRGDRAYLAVWDAGTWILDVTDPADPTFVSRVRGRSVEELAELGRSAARDDAFRLPGNDHYVAVNDAGDLLGIGIEAWGEPGPGGIVLYDVTDETDPERLARIAPPPTPDPSYDGVWTTAHNFGFDGDRLYSAWYQGGLKVHDVSDPANPTEIAAWRDTDAACFWTARSAADCVVAASSSQPPTLDIEERLYTFPDPGSGGPTPDGSTGTVTTGASGPGFGVLAGLAGLGLGAWRYGRDR
ncbi:MAG: LVIVD repeat-containing protein [Halorientalis sp.]